MKALVSIIVPVYNVPEKYFKICIESLINQTMKELEIIVVDDGSKNNLGAVCDMYAQKDNRVKVIHKKNGGVSTARNAGLKIITGKWLMFLDADDWIDYDTIEYVVNYSENNDVDILAWNHYYETSRGQVKREEISPSPLVRYNSNFDDMKMLALDTVAPEYDKRVNNTSVGAIRGVWAKLYKIDLIKQNKISFNENLVISEDAFFNLCCFEKGNKVVMINKYFNHYRVDESSAIRSYHNDICHINRNILDSFYDCLHKKDYKNAFDLCYMRMVCACIARSFNCKFIHRENKNSLQKNIYEIRLMLNERVYQNALNRPISNFFKFDEKIILWMAKKNMAYLLFLLFKLKSIIDSRL